MRLRLYLLLGTLTLFSCNLFAGRVDENLARQVAVNWYRHYAPQSKKQAVITKTIPYTYNGRECFHIFSFDKGGFVLVSANDAVTPVLGFGFNHSVPDSITNEAVKGWYDNYARQIDTAFVLNIQPDASMSKWNEILANRFAPATGDSVGPMLTTTWDQGCYYNELCPVDASGPCSHAWAGSTATAVAQVMKYHTYPPSGIGYREYYSSKYGYITKNFSHPIRFDSMPNALTGQNSSLSELLFDIGVAGSMQYNSSGSGAYFSDAAYGLIHYFDYNPTSIRYVNSALYTMEEWKNLLRTELDSARPLLYEGNGMWGSHALVCDGYTGDYFHFNYGWSGAYNGFYLLETLPLFNSGNFALIGIMPMHSGLSADYLTIDNADSLLTIRFIDFSKGNPETWQWDFGDGSTDSVQNPIHQFSSAGTRTVSLIVTKAGLADTISKNIFLPASFSNMKINAAIVEQGDLDWGDAENDGDMDLLVSGMVQFQGIRDYMTVLLRNEGNGNFTPLLINQLASNESHCKFIDFNKDGLLDFYSSNAFYENQNGTFNKMDFQITTPPWGYNPVFDDLDNDGNLDFLSGNKVYEFRNGKFTFTQNLNGTALAVADYDRDGDKDILTTSGVMKNVSGFFSIIPGFSFSPVYDVMNGTLQDFDFDGDLDLLVTGYNSGNDISRGIFRNNNGAFDYVNYGELGGNPGLFESIEWADLDNDGFLDIVYSGSNTRILKNNGNLSYQLDSSFVYHYNSNGKVKCGDYDNDGDLDFGLCHLVNANGSNYPLILFRNNSLDTNISPSVPGNLASIDSVNSIRISWDPSTDDHTPAAAISYNIYIQRAADSTTIVCPMADLTTGERQIAGNGNVNTNTSWKIHNLINGKYFWNVQAIDQEYKASAFALRDSFLIQGNNLSPEISSFKLSAIIKDTLAIQAGNFLVNYLDPEEDSLHTVKITQLPLFGVLYLNQVAVECEQSISINDLGLLRFVTDSIGVDSLKWKAFDGSSFSEKAACVTFESFLYKEAFSFPLTSERMNKIAVGDVNHDGKMDVLTGNHLYSYDNGNYNLIIDTLSGNGSNVVMTDIDNDGDLDIINGTSIYKNTNLAFTLENMLPANSIISASVFPADYNNDGMIDMLITGQLNDANSALYTKLLQQTDTGFVEVCNACFPGYYSSSAAWGDYNNDGLQDFVLMGATSYQGWGETGTLTLYRNLGNDQFAPLIIDANGYCRGSIDWGDYDRDGDMDLLVCGRKDFAGALLDIYRNDEGHFTEVLLPYSDGMHYIRDGSAKWFDYDNNGILDIVGTGYATLVWSMEERNVSFVLKNTNGSFASMNDGLSDLAFGNILFCDYDADGYSDILVSGEDRTGTSVIKMLRNFLGIEPASINTCPTTPTNLNTQQSGGSMNLSWAKSTDAQTAQDGLSYNLRVGISSDSLQIVSPLSCLSTGYHRVMQNGNTSMNNQWHIDSLPAGTYYWSVQAIDNSFAGSPFAPVQSFTIIPAVPASIILTNDTVTNGEANCYDATQTITVAGNGTTFLVKTGGMATMIAGQNIIYLPTTTVQSGGYLWGYIAPAGPWCQTPSMPAVVMAEDEIPRSIQQSSIKVYPNPTTGTFILELTNDADHVKVDIYGIWGEKVLSTVLSGDRKHEFSLSGKPVGIYFIRVVSGDKAETVKIIKQ